MARLPKSAIDKIHVAVDDLFDRAVKRFLGPGSIPKQLHVGYRRDLSLPGVYSNSIASEGGRPNLEKLDQLVDIAHNYLEAQRHKAKADLVHTVQSFISEADTGSDTEALDTKLGSELSDVFGKVKFGVRRILDTETQRARTAGTLEGLTRVAASVGEGDPSVCFIVVHDNDLCEECQRLHLLPDGKTPRVWKLSQVGYGYHNRGESNPKSMGLHPHCRCSMSLVLKGFGFSEAGRITWKNEGWDEYTHQQESGPE